MTRICHLHFDKWRLTIKVCKLLFILHCIVCLGIQVVNLTKVLTKLEVKQNWLFKSSDIFFWKDKHSKLFFGWSSFTFVEEYIFIYCVKHNKVFLRFLPTSTEVHFITIGTLFTKEHFRHALEQQEVLHKCNIILSVAYFYNYVLRPIQWTCIKNSIL